MQNCLTIMCTFVVYYTCTNTCRYIYVKGSCFSALHSSLRSFLEYEELVNYTRSSYTCIPVFVYFTAINLSKRGYCTVEHFSNRDDIIKVLITISFSPWRQLMVCLDCFLLMNIGSSYTNVPRLVKWHSRINPCWFPMWHWMHVVTDT